MTTIIFARVKYGSLSHKILKYARFKCRVETDFFTSQNYYNFRCNQVKPSDLKRSLDTLVKNGHLREVSKNQFKYVETHLLHKLENAYKQSSIDKRLNSEEIDDFA